MAFGKALKCLERVFHHNEISVLVAFPVVGKRLHDKVLYTSFI